MGRRVAILTFAVVGAVQLAGCAGARHTSPALKALFAEARPIGRGQRFHGRAHGPVIGRCRARLGARTAAHVEVFARNRVVLLPTGVGVRQPVRLREGRVAFARCYGEVVTLDPTGTALVRRGATATVGSLFRSWGVSLSSTRLAGFTAPDGTRVRTYIDGVARAGNPRSVPLTRHAEIVLEVGPYVPPHHRYVFPPGL
jgi:hypothetical protein